MKQLVRLALVGLLVSGCGVPRHPHGAQVLALDTYMVDGDAGFEGTALVKLRPRTLRPYGRRLRLGDAVVASAAPTVGVFAPDRKTLVLGGSNYGNLLFVDPGRLKVVKRIRIAKNDLEDVDVLSWPRKNLVVALTTNDGSWSSPHPSTLVFVDPERREVLRRVPVGGSVGAVSSLRDGTIVVLRLAATFGGVPGGPIVLETVDRRGKVRNVALPGLRLRGPDSVRVGGETFLSERTPGLATDGRSRAFVVAANRPIAEIMLRSLTVRYHRVPLSTRYLPSPKAAPPGSGGVHFELNRSASLLGDDLLSVGGFDELPALVPGFGVGHRESSMYAQIVDTRTWRIARTLPATGCQAKVGFVFCSQPVVALPNGLVGETKTGLIAYDRRWRIRFRRAPGFAYYHWVGKRLLVSDYSGRTLELDARTGKVRRRVFLPRYATDFVVWNPPT